MRYQLPADIPLTWSSAAEVRIGGSHIGSIVPDHPAVHAMLSALQLGTDEKFLRLLAKSHGLDRVRVDEVVKGLLSVAQPIATVTTGKQRVLVRTPPTAVPFAQLIAKEFARRYFEVTIVGADHRDHIETPDLVIEVAEYVIPTRRYLPLLAADTPHLAVVRDTGLLQVGPLVVPGETPCLRCDDLAKFAKHPEWPAVATQLVGSPEAMLPTEVEWLGALQIGMAGAAFLGPAHETPFGFSQVRIRASTGEISEYPRSFHAGCGCRVPTNSETVPLPREDTTAAESVALA